MGNTVLLLRSGRHLGAAITVLRRTLPSCHISVLSPPEGNRPLAGADVAADDRIPFPDSRFSPWRAIATGLVARLRERAFQQVVVLWNYPDGSGQENVTLTALLLTARRHAAMTPDGRLIEITWHQLLRTWWRRLTAGPRAYGRAAAAAWQQLRVRWEGPELDPPIWHSHFLSAWVVERALAEIATPLKGLILDVGSGTGYAGRALGPNATYLPTDLPNGRCGTDRSITTRGSRPVVQCSGDALPFSSSSLDGAMAVSVLEHVAHPDAILREAYRVVRPGGYLLLVTPFCFPFHGEPNDYRRWTSEGLAAEVTACGFEPERIDRLGASTTAITLNLHLTVKYQWCSSPSLLLRTVSGFWPLLFFWQALTNVLAMTIDRWEPRSHLPVSIALLARKPISNT